MTALLLTACVGMITGAFLIFRVSPMDFTLGVFRRLTAGPKSIRDDINETTQRKKPGFFRREISEAQTILQATGKEERFPVLCAASLLLFAVGAGIAIIMNNLLLVPVLAAGMMFLPFWYIKLTAGHYRKAVTAELETALSIITTAYLRSEDLQTAVEENINYLNPPVQGVFRSFLTRIKHIDPDMNAALAELKSAIDNEVWREWCEALSACQYDHSITPDEKSPTATASTLKSGYGVQEKVTAKVTTNQSAAVTAAQNAVTYFPEFGYESYWRLLEAEISGRSTTFQFKANPYSTYNRRTHFTPIWYPDGSYTPYTWLLDCWTPAGMLSMNLTGSVTIRGNLWEEWHIAPAKQR